VKEERKEKRKNWQREKKVGQEKTKQIKISIE
jgi:hypothetical protein